MKIYLIRTACDWFLQRKSKTHSETSDRCDILCLI